MNKTVMRAQTPARLPTVGTDLVQKALIACRLEGFATNRTFTDKFKAFEGCVHEGFLHQMMRLPY